MVIRTSIIKFAQIEYHGQSGITRDCLDAIIRLIHFGDRIRKVKLLTFDGRHCFLLYLDYENCIAIKCGFGSGYLGEGSRGLSTALQLLKRHGAEIEEHKVESHVIKSIDGSCLLDKDLKQIEASRPIRPQRWHDYVYEIDGSSLCVDEKLQAEFPTVLSFGLVDSRLVDLALLFEDNVDHAIFTAYKRLEDCVREKTGLHSENGQKLFSKAFQIENSKLYWKNIDPPEQNGRASLFIGAYMAFRNRRAHRESTTELRKAVQEFLLINILFSLESESVERPT
jgi:uncharacterized protein (TIGR02391 family)